jgi:hypothetical protein
MKREPQFCFRYQAAAARFRTRPSRQEIRAGHHPFRDFPYRPTTQMLESLEEDGGEAFAVEQSFASRREWLVSPTTEELADGLELADRPFHFESAIVPLDNRNSSAENELDRTRNEKIDV